MLTKQDLKQLQAMLDQQHKHFLNKKDLTAAMKQQRDEILSTTKSDLTAAMKQQKKDIIDELKDIIQKNTDDLIDLITTGFNIQSREHKINSDCLNDHEYRIKSIEKKVYSAN